MTYLTDRQINSNKFGESFNTWDFTRGRVLLSHKRILIYSCRCYMSTIDYLLSKYNGVVVDVRFDMIDYKDSNNNIIRDSNIEREAVLEKYGNRINEVTELVDYYYDLIVMNPPYSTYINNSGKKVVNPSQLMVERASQYLSVNGQIVILCRAQDIGMGAVCGRNTRNSINFDSIHYSTTNFNFKNVNAAIVGIIGGSNSSKCCNKTKVFIDNEIITVANKEFLPKIFRKSVVSELSLSILFKCFDEKNIKKFGSGDIGIWNGLASKTQAKRFNLKELDGLRYISVKNSKNWSIPGSYDEAELFDDFLTSKLFLVLADLEAFYLHSGGGGSASHFVKGLIPDAWRELSTNEKIYSHFNLTPEEIDFVENYTVQCYTK